MLRRSSAPTDRPALFAANFTLSHACWLTAYPIAGLVSAFVDIGVAFLVLAVLCGVGAILAWLVWPASDPETVPHQHDDLPPGHPHLAAHGPDHTHAVVIDEWHRRWPDAAK